MPLPLSREVDLATSDQPRLPKPCGYASCNDKPIASLTMRLGGRDMTVPVCESHNKVPSAA